MTYFCVGMLKNMHTKVALRAVKCNHKCNIVEGVLSCTHLGVVVGLVGYDVAPSVCPSRSVLIVSCRTGKRQCGRTATDGLLQMAGQIIRPTLYAQLGQSGLIETMPVHECCMEMCDVKLLATN